MSYREARTVVAISLVAAVLLLLWPAREMRSENFVFYLPDNTHQLIPLETVKQANYLPLLQVLNLVGKVNGLSASEKSLKIWFETSQIQVQDNKRKVLINQSPISLAEPVRLEQGRWLAPLDFVQLVLPKILHQNMEYVAGGNRLFLGDVRPSTYSVRLEPEANGTRLSIEFTDKLTVRSAVTNGKWVMLLEGRPVEPMEADVPFQSPFVHDLKFDDQDGVPKLILTPAAEGLNFYLTATSDGKGVNADILKQPSAVAQQAGQPANPQAQPAAPSAGETAPATALGQPMPTVVLDAGHGGADTGARSMNGVLEKDLVQQIVLQVRGALLATGKYHVVQTRLGDDDPDFDQRDVIANTAHPDAFLTFHAGNLGPGTPRVVVYTYQPSSPPPSGITPGLVFTPWSEAQESHLPLSQLLAQGLEQQFQKLPGMNVSKTMAAPVRALRSVDAPAVAIEVGSLTPTLDASALTSPGFQEEVATAVVQALNAVLRGRT